MLGSRDPSRAQAAAQAVGGRAVALDLADEATIASALDDAGAVDHVVSTASAAATSCPSQVGEGLHVADRHAGRAQALQEAIQARSAAS